MTFIQSVVAENSLNIEKNKKLSEYKPTIVTYFVTALRQGSEEYLLKYQIKDFSFKNATSIWNVFTTPHLEFVSELKNVKVDYEKHLVSGYLSDGTEEVYKISMGFDHTVDKDYTFQLPDSTNSD